MLVPGLQPALRAERARFLVGKDAAELEPAREHRVRARGRARVGAAQHRGLDAVHDHLLVRLALGVSGEELVACHQGRHGVRNAQVRELHARAGRERRGVVAGDSRQDFGRARAVAARERDLGVETRLFARIGCGERLREIGDRGFGSIGLRRLQPFARRREPERVRRVGRGALRGGFKGARRTRVIALLREARGTLRRGVGSTERGQACHLAGREHRGEQDGGGIPGEPEFRLHRRRPLARIARPPAAVGEDIL